MNELYAYIYISYTKTKNQKTNLTRTEIRFISYINDDS